LNTKVTVHCPPATRDALQVVAVVANSPTKATVSGPVGCKLALSLVTVHNRDGEVWPTTVSSKVDD
jgi:hypothetical protein